MPHRVLSSIIVLTWTGWIGSSCYALQPPPFSSVSCLLAPEPPLAIGPRVPPSFQSWLSNGGSAPPLIPLALITTRYASRIATIPVQPDAGATQNKGTGLGLGEEGGRVDCPHLDSSLLLWENPASWGERVFPPSSGNVTLPANARILLSPCSLGHSVHFDVVTIPFTSALVIADAPIAISANSIVVHGALVLGSESCRAVSTINITLRGSRPIPIQVGQFLPSDDFRKSIAVVGSGVVDLHGAHFAPTWTRLAARASAGARWIFLQQIVNWDVGSFIVITTTALKDSRDFTETEEHEIIDAFTLPTGHTALRLASPLKFHHWASSEYQAEVGLLSRRVVVEGSKFDSPPTDASGPLLCAPVGSLKRIFGTLPCPSTHLTGYGGTIRVLGDQAVLRISGVELFQMGQTNYKGRTPIRFDSLGSGGVNSFVRDISVWHSYYRCVSVASTNGLFVERIVAHNIIGHCIHLVYGNEENNTFVFNLVSHVHPIIDAKAVFAAGGYSSRENILPDIDATSTLTNPSDIAASCFFIPNAQNNISGNAASGGWSGFFFATLPTDIIINTLGRRLQFGEELGVSHSGARSLIGDLMPVSQPTLAFTGNTAHSSGYYWSQSGCVHVGGVLGFRSEDTMTLTFNPGMTFTTGTPWTGITQLTPQINRHALTQFNDTKVFLCNGAGVHHWGALPQINNIELHDMGARGFTSWGEAVISSALFTCRTGNPVSTGEGLTPQSMELIYALQKTVLLSQADSAAGQSLLIRDIIIRNCSGSARLFKFPDHTPSLLPDVMLSSANLTYELMPNVTKMLKDSFSGTLPTQYLQSWSDTDGSLTQRKSPTLLGSAIVGRWWHLDSDCEMCNACHAWLCDLVNGRALGSLFLGFNVLQEDIGTEASEMCTNNMTCPVVGTVSHLGYHTDPSAAMNVTLNTRITGPINGFGWVLGGGWLPPVSLVVSAIQVSRTKVMLLVLPYPIGTTFNITLRAGKGCGELGDSLLFCNWPLKQVRSAEAVRSGLGDDYFFDETTGHLYVRLTAHSSSGIGKLDQALGRVDWYLPSSTELGQSYVVPKGLRVPARGGATLNILADCKYGLDTTKQYCLTSAPPALHLPVSGLSTSQPVSGVTVVSYPLIPELLALTLTLTTAASPCPASVRLPLQAFDSCTSASRSPKSVDSGITNMNIYIFACLVGVILSFAVWLHYTRWVKRTAAAEGEHCTVRPKLNACPEMGLARIKVVDVHGGDESPLPSAQNIFQNPLHFAKAFGFGFGPGSANTSNSTLVAEPCTDATRPRIVLIPSSLNSMGQGQWTRITDGPAADDFYFVNAENGVKSWILPPGVLNVKGAVEEKWRLVPGSSFDDLDMYYINTANGATSWDPPAGSIIQD